MTKKTTHADSPADVVRQLTDVADTDTVYRDVYLRRAHALLAPQLTAEQYRGMQALQGQIEELTAGSRAAARLQDWKFVRELSQRVEGLRRGAAEKAPLQAVGELVFDAPTVAIDPFSPGLAALAKAGDLADQRDQIVAALGRLGAADREHATFYEARRAFFGGLAVARRTAAAETKESKSPRAVADLERFAFEAAERGDVTELGRLSQEILAAQEAAAKKPAAPDENRAAAAAPAALGGCPVDLAAPFPADAVARARALGLAAARTEPVPHSAPLIDYVTARLGQPVGQQAESEHEGAMKIEGLVDPSAWPPGVADSLKTLVTQFVRNAFVSSGGARYRPVFGAESVLVEDFPEDQEPPTDAKLLTSLGLGARRALSRDEVETALLEHGARIVEKDLGLDPLECRLVCIPQDIYTRFGRDRGWGAQRQWTHFDGYQVVKGGRLRALVGGDVRYGGIVDFVSIATSDKRDSVVVRFAVIRRARQVARWR